MADNKVVNYKVRKQVEELMKTPFKVLGDYRKYPYMILVNKAVSILHHDLFGEGKNPKHMSAYATCCRAWGEKRNLLAQHPKDRVLEAGSNKEVTIKSQNDLAAMIIGAEPTSTDLLWTVEFPKTSVVCSLQVSSNKEVFINKLMTTAAMWFDGDCSTLGKRLGSKTETKNQEIETTDLIKISSKRKKTKSVASQTERTTFPYFQKDETSKKISMILNRLSKNQDKQELLRKLEVLEEQMRESSWSTPSSF